MRESISNWENPNLGSWFSVTREHAEPISRRRALELIGMGGAAASLAACGEGPGSRLASTPSPWPAAPAPSGGPSQWMLEWAGKPVSVATYSPSGISADRPMVVALHGMMRNAPGMFNRWAPWADLFGMHIVVPHFEEEHFPGDSYSMGGAIVARVGERPIDAIGPIIEQAKTHAGLAPVNIGLFGHSAGAQLAHRYLMLADECLVGSAVFAGAGWYTMPDGDTRWPYGLDGTGVGLADLDRCWSTKVLVLVGDQDTGTQNLRTSRAAMATGGNRVDRGKAYFDKAGRVAQARGIPLDWSFEIIPGAGHECSRAVDRASLFLSA